MLFGYFSDVLVYWHEALCSSVRRLSGICLSFAIVLPGRILRIRGLSAGSLEKKLLASPAAEFVLRINKLTNRSRHGWNARVRERKGVRRAYLAERYLSNNSRTRVLQPRGEKRIKCRCTDVIGSILIKAKRNTRLKNLRWHDRTATDRATESLIRKGRKRSKILNIGN